MATGLSGVPYTSQLAEAFPVGLSTVTLYCPGLSEAPRSSRADPSAPFSLAMNSGFCAQNGLGVLPVDQDFGVLFGELAIKFHLEVETAPAQETGRIHRIDARRGFRDAGEKQGAQQGGNDACVHEISLC